MLQIKVKEKEYDCIVGLSGGVDSSFVVYKAKELGLRPLVVHLDNGWNTEIAVHNIENVVKILGIDLYTHVIDWEEFRDLQKAFLRSSTPDSEVPTRLKMPMPMPLCPAGSVVDTELIIAVWNMVKPM